MTSTWLYRRLAQIELVATVARRARAGDLCDADASAVLAAIDGEFQARFDVIELGGAVMNRAESVVRTHALRAADGMQLASALVGLGGGAAAGGFVSSEHALNAAAETEGLRVIDPQAR